MNGKSLSCKKFDFFDDGTISQIVQVKKDDTEQMNSYITDSASEEIWYRTDEDFSSLKKKKNGNNIRNKFI